MNEPVYIVLLVWRYVLGIKRTAYYLTVAVNERGYHVNMGFADAAQLGTHKFRIPVNCLVIRPNEYVTCVSTNTGKVVMIPMPDSLHQNSAQHKVAAATLEHKNPHVPSADG